MHGGVMGPMRQVLMTARPWQRAAVGAAVAVVGVLLGSIVLTAIGALLFVLPIVRGATAWWHRRHGGEVSAAVRSEFEPHPDGE